jgi:hypothetical protein
MAPNFHCHFYTRPPKLVTMQPRGAKITDFNIFTMAPNIVSFLGTEHAWRHTLTPRFLRWLLNLLKICTPLM